MSLGFFWCSWVCKQVSLLFCTQEHFCGDLHTFYFMCGKGCYGVSSVSLAESLLGWIIYSPVFKQVLPFHPFITWAVLGLSFALCFESVRSFISLDPGNNLLVPNTLFFPNKRLVYNWSQSSAVNTRFLHSLDRSCCLLTPAVSSSSSISPVQRSVLSFILHIEFFPTCARDRHPMASLPETALMRHLQNGLQHPQVST